MKNTITAFFENVDMAEVAARKIKHNYPQVSNIKIKYKSMNSGNSIDTAIPAIVPGLSASNMIGAGYYPASLGLVADEVTVENNNANTPECYRSTKSKLIIQADNCDVKKISGTLRSLGGMDISDIDFVFKT